MPRNTPPAHLTQGHLDIARRIAAHQEGVASRRQLYAAGIPRWEITGHLRAQRWQRVGQQCLAVFTGPPTQGAQLWAAVLEGGPRAHLDGAAALVASGLKGYRIDKIRVSVPRGARRSRVGQHGLFDIRQTRRWDPADLATSGIPRTLPAVAAVRGALWATSDKQATYLLALTVQQGLAAPEGLGLAALAIKRDKRRLLVHAVVNDLMDGGRALGELDVVRELRRRGLPAPAQQVLRRDKAGRYYLDLYWPELGVVVEIDGIHHAWAQNVVGDALRQNALTLANDVVLRLPLLGLRLQPDDFYGQIAEALAAGEVRRAA